MTNGWASLRPSLKPSLSTQPITSSRTQVSCPPCCQNCQKKPVNPPWVISFKLFEWQGRGWERGWLGEQCIAIPALWTKGLPNPRLAIAYKLACRVCSNYKFKYLTRYRRNLLLNICYQVMGKLPTWWVGHYSTTIRLWTKTMIFLKRSPILVLYGGHCPVWRCSMSLNTTSYNGPQHVGCPRQQRSATFFVLEHL